MSEQHSIKYLRPSIDIDNGDPLQQFHSASLDSADSNNGKIRQPLLSYNSDISNRPSPSHSGSPDSNTGRRIPQRHNSYRQSLRERIVLTHAQTPPGRSLQTLRRAFRRAASFPPNRNSSSAPFAPEMMGRGGRTDDAPPVDGGGAAGAGMRRRHPAHAYEADAAAGSPPHAAYPSARKPVSPSYGGLAAAASSVVRRLSSVELDGARAETELRPLVDAEAGGAGVFGGAPVPLEPGGSVAAVLSGAAPPPSIPADPDRLFVMGCDLSHLSPAVQFATCSGGVFAFTLVYGYLQELIVVTLCGRKLSLFLAMVQFGGYAIWSAWMRHLSPRPVRTKARVPMARYLRLSLLRAFDLGFTNLAMAHLNYPAKTMIKSSRVVFTMAAGAIGQKKRYSVGEYVTVCLMAAGLVIFMNADAKTSAIFAPIGIFMLIASLCCDAVISTNSEQIMKTYDVGQDEFIFNLYTIALVSMGTVTILSGDMAHGLSFLLTPGTMAEIEAGSHPTWSPLGKAVALAAFASTGFFGSSFAGAITRRFSALAMSIVSTTRKATTLFLSFAFFPKECTPQHMLGMVLFMVALFVKSLRAGRKGMKMVKSSAALTELPR